MCQTIVSGVDVREDLESSVCTYTRLAKILSEVGLFLSMVAYVTYAFVPTMSASYQPVVYGRQPDLIDILQYGNTV